MKALYIIWPDFDYIEKLINAGIDTLIVANIDEPNDVNPSNPNKVWGGWGSWKDTISILNRYNNDPRVKVIFAPLWVRYWEDLPLDQQFHTKNGTIKPRTPCPSSEQFVQNRIAYAKSVAYNYNVDIAFDMEHYLNESDGNNVGVIEIYKKKSKERLKCVSSNAGSLKNQYKKHSDNIKNRISDLSFVGFFPYGNYWICKMFGKRGVFFDESTYNGIRFKDKWKAFWRKLFTGTKTVAGIWTEVHTPDELIDEIKKAESIAFDGYWLYSQSRFSRNSEMHRKGAFLPQVNPYYVNLIDQDDPNFFNRLKDVN